MEAGGRGLSAQVEGFAVGLWRRGRFELDPERADNGGEHGGGRGGDRLVPGARGCSAPARGFGALAERPQLLARHPGNRLAAVHVEAGAGRRHRHQQRGVPLGDRNNVLGDQEVELPGGQRVDQRRPVDRVAVDLAADRRRGNVGGVLKGPEDGAVDDRDGEWVGGFQVLLERAGDVPVGRRVGEPFAEQLGRHRRRGAPRAGGAPQLLGDGPVVGQNDVVGDLLRRAVGSVQLGQRAARLDGGPVAVDADADAVRDVGGLGVSIEEGPDSVDPVGSRFARGEPGRLHVEVERPEEQLGVGFDVLVQGQQPLVHHGHTAAPHRKSGVGASFPL